MAASDIRRLMDNARVHLPGALDDNIQLELFNALREFLKDTNLWREDIPFASRIGIRTYYIGQTGNAAIERLMWVTDEGGRSVAATMAIPGEVTLGFSPDQAARYVATVALTISDPTTKDGYPNVPAWITNKYGDGILEGVLSRMMAQPAKPWFSERLAIYHARQFRVAVSSARVDARAQNVYRAQPWRFPQSFATSR